MIKLLHSISKIGAIIWTALCLLLLFSMFMGLGAANSSQSAGDETASLVAGSIGFVFLAVTWFFPTVGAVIIMYLTRPQAWESKSPQG